MFVSESFYYFAVGNTDINKSTIIPNEQRYKNLRKAQRPACLDTRDKARQHPYHLHGSFQDITSQNRCQSAEQETGQDILRNRQGDE